MKWDHSSLCLLVATDKEIRDEDRVEHLISGCPLSRFFCIGQTAFIFKEAPPVPGSMRLITTVLGDIREAEWRNFTHASVQLVAIIGFYEPDSVWDWDFWVLYMKTRQHSNDFKAKTTTQITHWCIFTIFKICKNLLNGKGTKIPQIFKFERRVIFKKFTKIAPLIRVRNCKTEKIVRFSTFSQSLN